MVNLIMGLKGSGKTKKLVELVRKAVDEEQGSVVCIEKDKNLTYDIPYTVRLIHAGDYGIKTYEMVKGFISGLHAGNYDISCIFIDNFYKMVEDASNEKVEEFLKWLSAFSERESVKFTICATIDPSQVSEEIRKYCL